VAPLVPHFAEPQRKALRAKAKAKRREVQRAAWRRLSPLKVRSTFAYLRFNLRFSFLSSLFSLFHYLR
jgi:hypothetical protein